MSDAIGGNQSLGVRKRDGGAGRGHGLGLFEARGNGKVQVQKLGQQVLLGGEAVGGEDGGVQGGVGVFKRVRAGRFEGAVEATEAAFHFSQRLGAHTPDLAPCPGYCLHLSRRGRL